MKKYKSVVICLAILILAAILLPTPSLSEVIVGRGDGSNEEIGNIEDLLGMLYCIQGSGAGSLSINQNDVLSAEDAEELVASLIGFTTSSNSSAEPLSSAPAEKLASERKASDEKEITDFDFDSFTVHEYARLKLGYYMDVRSSLERDLSMYVCDEIVYYRSVGKALSISETVDDDGDITDVRSFADFDIEFYIDSDEGDVFMKINYFYMLDEESVCFSNEIIGKWLDVDSPDFIRMMLLVNDQNLSSLSELTSAIQTAYFDGEIKNKVKTQSLKKKDFGDYYKEAFEKFDVKIDISNSEKPVISLLASAENDYGDKTITSEINAVYTFENIDNTEVSMGKNVDIFEIDEDDIEDYIWYED